MWPPLHHFLVNVAIVGLLFLAFMLTTAMKLPLIRPSIVMSPVVEQGFGAWLGVPALLATLRIGFEVLARVE